MKNNNKIKNGCENEGRREWRKRKKKWKSGKCRVRIVRENRKRKQGILPDVKAEEAKERVKKYGTAIYSRVIYPRENPKTL